ncbi:MAG: ABC transporter ATP-binding protein [Syntrophomonadaceae bacterium]|nr:ABC transporter ATP-binding protein [Syntrophomonadaceae bacterium]
MTDTVLSVQGVVFAYPDGTCALRGVSLDIPRGRKTAVLGPNGAGKTTLLLHLNGTCRPLRGEVKLDGVPVSYGRRELARLRQAVGVVFQDVDLQLLGGTVFQDVSFGPMNLGLAMPEVKERVADALERIGIGHLASRPVHSLSHGEKKMVAVAGALALRPRVLALDEPTAGLEPRAATQLLQVLDGLAAQGTTVVISTHDADIALSWADRLVVMEAGSVVCTGSPREVYAARWTEGYLASGPPAAVQIYWFLRERGLWPEMLPVPTDLRQLLSHLELLAGAGGSRGAERG